MFHADCLRGWAPRGGSAVGLVGGPAPFLGRDSSRDGRGEVHDDDPVRSIQGRGRFALAPGPHQRSDPLQHPVQALDGKGDGQKGQLPTSDQGLAVLTKSKIGSTEIYCH